MAYAYPSDDEDFQSDSLTQMSDEIREMYCEHCETENGTHVTADGFCVDCVEYLCVTCLRYHKKYIPQHSLQDIANMPLDFCFDKCPNHPEEIIKFYCKLCVDTACSKCKSEKHGDCSEVCHIPAVVQSDNLSDKLERVKLSIEETLEDLAAKQERLASNREEVRSNKKNFRVAIINHKATLTNQVENQHKKLLDDLDIKQMHEMDKHEQKRAEIIEKLDEERTKLMERFNAEKRHSVQQLQDRQKEVFDTIDEIENELEEHSEQLNEKDMDQLSTVSSKLNSNETEVKDMKQSIKRKMRTGEKCVLIVELVKVNRNLVNLRSKENELDRHISNFEFKPYDDDINLELSNNTVTFGYLLGRSKVKRTVTFAGDIKLKSDNDVKSSYVTGICVCSGYIVLADSANNSIQLIDIKENKVLSVLKLKNDPFDVIWVNADKVATTVPKAGRIQYLSVTKAFGLSMADEIVVGQPCYGIEYLKPHILVACHDPGCVHFMSTSGHTIKTLTSLIQPIYITINPNKEKIYVEDTDGKDRVVIGLCISGEEEVSLDFPSERLKGLSVDNFGSIYTISYVDSAWPFTLGHKSEPTLCQLSANLEVIQKTDITLECPDQKTSLFYCNKENKLYVGTDRGRIFILKVS